MVDSIIHQSYHLISRVKWINFMVFQQLCLILMLVLMVIHIYIEFLPWCKPWCKPCTTILAEFMHSVPMHENACRGRVNTKAPMNSTNKSTAAQACVLPAHVLRHPFKGGLPECTARHWTRQKYLIFHDFAVLPQNP